MDEQEWEILRIVGKRRKGTVYEDKRYWKRTWLHERESENAQELLREFEAKRRKRGRLARADMGR